MALRSTSCSATSDSRAPGFAVVHSRALEHQDAYKMSEDVLVGAKSRGELRTSRLQEYVRRPKIQDQAKDVRVEDERRSGVIPEACQVCELPWARLTVGLSDRRL